MPAIMPDEFIKKPQRTVQDLAVGEEEIILRELSVFVNLKGETYVVPSTPLPTNGLVQITSSSGRMPMVIAYGCQKESVSYKTIMSSVGRFQLYGSK